MEVEKMTTREKESGVERLYWRGMGRDTLEEYVAQGKEAVIRGRGYRASHCARRMVVAVTGLEADVVGPLRETGLYQRTWKDDDELSSSGRARPYYLFLERREKVWPFPSGLERPRSSSYDILRETPIPGPNVALVFSLSVHESP